MDSFTRVNEKNQKQDINHLTYLLKGAFIVFGSAIFACLSRETLSPGVVGLAVSYALSITLDITMIVRYYCDIETNIVSVERIKEVSSFFFSSRGWEREGGEREGRICKRILTFL